MLPAPLRSLDEAARRRVAEVIEQVGALPQSVAAEGRTTGCE
jgi:hypothetical protein